MEFIAFQAVQPSTQPQPPGDASTEVNSAGWGILLWVIVLGVVFFALLAAAGLGLLPSRRRTRD